MKAYSLDLRTKILTAYLHKEGSVRQLAQRFKVSARFVGELVIRFRHTGSCAPKPHGGGNPPRIDRSHDDVLFALVQQRPDATLKELCSALEARGQVTASKSSMQRTLVRMQLTRKKTTVAKSTGVTVPQAARDRLLDPGESAAAASAVDGGSPERGATLARH